MSTFKLILISIVASLCLATAQVTPSPHVKQGINSTPDEYDVFSTLVNDMYVKDKVKLIVITDPTCCDTNLDMKSETWKMYLEQLAPLSVETLEDYVSRNEQALALEKKFNLKTKYQIVPYVNVKNLFSNFDLDAAWKTFYSRYPASGGYIRLSRVGFNKAKDQALVSTAWMCNTLCGEGNYVLLSKQQGSWKVLKKVVTWVS